jgi:hypothetical protein
MSCSCIERLPDEPILIFTFEGKIDYTLLNESFIEAEADIRDIAVQFGGYVFYVIDVTAVEVSFMDMMDVLKHNNQIGNVISEVTEARMYMVGTGAMAKFYVQAVSQEQYGAQRIPLFVSRDAALGVVRHEIRTLMPDSKAAGQ